MHEFSCVIETYMIFMYIISHLLHYISETGTSDGTTPDDTPARSSSGIVLYKLQLFSDNETITVPI